MLEIGDIIKLRIESLATSGSGVGYYVADTKRAVFVPFSCPGDILEVTILSKNKAYYEAEIETIVEPSSFRRSPVCKHFSECGACDWLHINYEKQISEKTNLLRFFLKKHNLSECDMKIIPAEKEYHYRDKIRVPGVGFYARKSKSIIPIEKCWIINDAFNNSSVFKTRKKEEAFGFDYDSGSVTQKRAFYFYKDIKIKYLPTSFVQANLGMDKYLIDNVLENLIGENILELYAGNGNFTLPIVASGKKVMAVEGDDVGYALLQENLTENNLIAKAIHLDAKSFIEKSKKQWDTIVVDPPRSGVDNLFKTMDSKRIIYISCSPDQALREIKTFDNYKLSSAILVDMFPNTRHFEAIFVLDRI